MSSLTRQPLALITRLRDAGLNVPIGSTLAFIESLNELEDNTRSLYWAGRVNLAHGQTEIEIYDSVFRAWLFDEQLTPQSESAPTPIALEYPDEDSSIPEGDSSDNDTQVARFSRIEILQKADIGELNDEEKQEIYALIEQLQIARPMRRSRRRKPTRNGGGQLDLRTMMKSSMATDGEFLRRHRTDYRKVPRRLVLCADVSGSMETYARALLRFAHAAVLSRGNIEVFLLGTSLTRVTRQLERRDADIAVATAAAAVPDWASGTRLGESLEQLMNDWGNVTRGAVVVILSDGWDRGDAQLLAQSMERLQRAAARLVWVNPLKGGEGYEPLAKGMATALPFIDEFVEGHSFASLHALSDVIAGVKR